MQFISLSPCLFSFFFHLILLFYFSLLLPNSFFRVFTSAFSPPPCSDQHYVDNTTFSIKLGFKVNIHIKLVGEETVTRFFSYDSEEKY